MTDPKIVCLCGSTRFFQQFQEANYRLTMEGYIVLAPGFYPHSDVHGEGVGITPEEKERLDQLHLRKVDLANEIFVVNVGGYVGDSTFGEIVYAAIQGKPIRFLSSQSTEHVLYRVRVYLREVGWTNNDINEALGQS